MEQIYAVAIHWNDGYVVRKFVILWSDHTWEEIVTPIEDEWMIKSKTGKSYKEFMNLRKIIRMTREQAMEYINNKFKEYENMRR